MLNNPRNVSALFNQPNGIPQLDANGIVSRDQIGRAVAIDKAQYGIYEWWDDETDHITIFQPTFNERQTARWSFAKVGNIVCVDTIEVGKNARAVHFVFEDVIHGDGGGDSSSSGYRIHFLNAQNEYSEYTVGASGVGCTRLRMAYVRSSSGGTCSVQVMTGAGALKEDIADVDTSSGLGLVLVDIDITVTLEATDTIRFTADTADSVRIGGAMLLADEAPAVDEEVDFWDYDGGCTIHVDSSSFENATYMCADAGTPHWIGGQAHQSLASTNGGQTSVTETWTENRDDASSGPTAWTPAYGFSRGAIGMVRDSTLSWDATTHLATCREEYEWMGHGFTYSWRATASESVDYVYRYQMMLSLPTDLTASRIVSGGAIFSDLNDVGNNKRLGLMGDNQVSVLSTDLSVYPTIQWHFPELYRTMMKHVDSGTNKLYAEPAQYMAYPSGGTIVSGASMWFA